MTNQELLSVLKELSLLEGGVKTWNQFRQENPNVKFDFSNTNLSGTNLSGADLSNTNLSGTNLSGADLSSANLSNADLSNVDLSGTDLSGANLDGVDLSGDRLSRVTLNLDDLLCVSLRGLNLSNLDLNWIDFEGINLRDIDLNGIDFRGVNLSGIDLSNVEEIRNIDLTDINFSDADLSNANLRAMNLNGIKFSNANLSGVNFAQVQALETNFTGAILTGACLEDWNINSETNLDGIICEYVYLKQKQQERRPSSGSFKPGEFTTLFQKALETVDLIFADGIDWQAFFQSFQELRSQYDNLSIQAIEKKSGGAFVIRLEVPPEADKAAIESQAKELYEMKLQLLEAQYQQQLQLKDVEIDGYRRENTNLLGIVNLLGSRPINAISIAESQSMGNRNIHMGSGNYNERIEGNYVQGNYINMSQNLTQAAQQIQDLLQQLQNQGVTIETAQQQVATDMAKQAETNPAMMGKLVLWGKAMANKASETTVSEAAKIVFTLALKAAGLA